MNQYQSAKNSFLPTPPDIARITDTCREKEESCEKWHFPYQYRTSSLKSLRRQTLINAFFPAIRECVLRGSYKENTNGDGDQKEKETGDIVNRL